MSFYGIDIKDNRLITPIKKRFIERLFFSPFVDAKDSKRMINAMNKASEDRIASLDQKLMELGKEFEMPKSSKCRETLENFMETKLKEWGQIIGELSHREISKMNNLYKLKDSDPFKTNLSKDSNKFGAKSPSEISQKLDNTIIGQNEAKKTLSFVFYLHMLRTERIRPSILQNTTGEKVNMNYTDLPKPNILLCGPTGSGKTFIIKTLSEMFDVPFAKVDCASLVSSGYVGNNLNTVFRQLIDKASSINEAEKGIIYFDEIDKISEDNIGRSGSVGGTELQQEFLTVLEDKERIVYNNKSGQKDSITINTENILYVFSGSFAGIEQHIEKRLQVVTTIGFNSNSKNEQSSTTKKKDLLKKINAEDVISFGLIPELVGRLNYFVALNQLKKEDIIKIIKESDQSPLKLYTNFFHAHLDELTIEEEVFPLIAERVLEIGGGGRAITSVLQQLLNEYLYTCPNKQMEHYIVTPEYFKKVFSKN